MAKAATHVAFLRGINVGGKNTLPMQALKAIFEDCGCADVRTYIQSGNVVFTAASRSVARIGRDVEAAIASEHGISSPVVMRSAKELQSAIEAYPFPDAEEGARHIGFLASKPTQVRIERLDSDRSPRDAFRVIGMDVHLHCPNGVARTKLTNTWFDSVLETTSTMRNWRTACRVLAMATAPEG